MKTSKIIFISLLSTITLLILAAAIIIRISGHKNGGSRSDFKMSKQTLPSFKVLRINNSMNITLIRKDSSYLEVTCLKDSILPNLKYILLGDTLMVSDFENSDHQNTSVKIFATDSLKKIQLFNTTLSTERLGMGKLVFELDQSNLDLNQDLLMKLPISAIELVANHHSQIKASEFSIDSLTLQLRDSQAYLDLLVKNIRGTLSDSSVIRVRQPQEISLRKDATSTINVFD